MKVKVTIMKDGSSVFRKEVPIEFIPVLVASFVDENIYLIIDKV